MPLTYPKKLVTFLSKKKALMVQEGGRAVSPFKPLIYLQLTQPEGHYNYPYYLHNKIIVMHITVI
jgi:hypothetical protein